MLPFDRSDMQYKTNHPIHSLPSPPGSSRSWTESDSEIPLWAVQLCSWVKFLFLLFAYDYSFTIIYVHFTTYYDMNDDVLK